LEEKAHALSAGALERDADRLRGRGDVELLDLLDDFFDTGPRRGDEDAVEAWHRQERDGGGLLLYGLSLEGADLRGGCGLPRRDGDDAASAELNALVELIEDADDAGGVGLLKRHEADLDFGLRNNVFLDPVDNREGGFDVL